MFFIGGGGGLGGRGAVSADNTPAQRKTPLNPPPQTPPFLNLALGGVLSMISDFRESPPPCSEGSKQWGSRSLLHNRRSNGNAADAKFSVAGSNAGRLTVGGGGGGGSEFTSPGLYRRPKRLQSAALPFGHCLVRGAVSPHCLGPRLPLTKKTQTVCFCLTDCWPG